MHRYTPDPLCVLSLICSPRRQGYKHTHVHAYRLVRACRRTAWGLAVRRTCLQAYVRVCACRPTCPSCMCAGMPMCFLPRVFCPRIRRRTHVPALKAPSATAAVKQTSFQRLKSPAALQDGYRNKHVSGSGSPSLSFPGLSLPAPSFPTLSLSGPPAISPFLPWLQNPISFPGTQPPSPSRIPVTHPCHASSPVTHPLHTSPSRIPVTHPALCPPAAGMLAQYSCRALNSSDVHVALQPGR